MSHEQATMLLSHAFLICRLISNEAMSTAQAAKVVRARDQRVKVSWQAIDEIAKKLGIKPSIKTEELQHLLQHDRALEEPEFADSDLASAIELVGARARYLGFPGRIETH